jgi:hypothetical protein
MEDLDLSAVWRRRVKLLRTRRPTPSATARWLPAAALKNQMASYYMPQRAGRPHLPVQGVRADR